MAKASDVIVKPGQPLYITDGNRDFGTLTIMTGGQVYVQTQAEVRIAKLVKA